MDFGLQPKELELLNLLENSDSQLIGYGGARGGAKAAPLDSLVLTPFGFRRMGDIKVGDQVSCPDGTVARVIAVHDRGVRDVFRLTFSDGATCRVADDHLWLAWRTTHKRKADRRYFPFLLDNRVDARIETTSALKAFLDKEGEKGKNNDACAVHIPLTEPVTFTKSYKTNQRTVDPYVLGLILGDGCVRGSACEVTAWDQEIVDAIETALPGIARVYPTSHKGGWRVRICEKKFRDTLSAIGVWGKLSHEKRVPAPYLLADVEARRSLLRGLMDTDGTVDDRGHASFTSTSRGLAEDVQWLGRSLGFKATVTTTGPGSYRDSTGSPVECKDVWHVQFGGRHTGGLFRLKRKRERGRAPLCTGRRMVSIEPDGAEQVRCITVDHPAGLYLMDDFIVTHNSHAARACAVIRRIQHPGTNAMIFRRTYPSLWETHIAKLLTEWPELYQRYWSQENKALMLPGNSTVLFRYADTLGDIMEMRGKEYGDLLIDEATDMTEEELKVLFSCCRSSVSGFSPKKVLTFNPGGVGHQFVKRLFIDKNQTQAEAAQYPRFIQAKATDNVEWFKDALAEDGIPLAAYREWTDDQRLKYLTERTAYGKELNALPHDLRGAWLLGLWDTFSGQYFTMFDPTKHVEEIVECAA